MAKKKKEPEAPAAFEPETIEPVAPIEEPRQATVAQGNVRRFHKTKPSRVFKTGEPIPADWYESADGMNTGTEEENWQ